MAAVYAIRKGFSLCSQLGDIRDDFGLILSILGLPAQDRGAERRYRRLFRSCRYYVGLGNSERLPRVVR